MYIIERPRVADKKSLRMNMGDFLPKKLYSSFVWIEKCHPVFLASSGNI